jgi:hypothetical protein
MKLKNPSELMKMLKGIDPANLETYSETLNYISSLERVAKNYQIVIDTAIQKNEDIGSKF